MDSIQADLFGGLFARGVPTAAHPRLSGSQPVLLFAPILVCLQRKDRVVPPSVDVAAEFPDDLRGWGGTLAKCNATMRTNKLSKDVFVMESCCDWVAHHKCVT